jgi:hypothetical protein
MRNGPLDRFGLRIKSSIPLFVLAIGVLSVATVLMIQSGTDTAPEPWKKLRHGMHQARNA